MQNKIFEQVLILEAIENVRKEIRKASMRGANSIEIYEISERLISLYALINVEVLTEAVSDSHNDKMAA